MRVRSALGHVRSGRAFSPGLSRFLLGAAVLLPLGFVGCAGLSSSPLEVSESGATLLEGRTVDAWARLLDPVDDGTDWRSIPWHTSYYEGALAAAEEGKPLLLWLMNGHPLGCT